MQDNQLLSTVANLIEKGSYVHKEKAFWLIGNLVVNSYEDALAISQNGGIVFKVLEAIRAKRDHKVTYEANLVLFYILSAIAQIEDT